jgi:hypothetical protein
MNGTRMVSWTAEPRAIVLALAIACAACTSYATVLREFDSVAQRVDSASEPSQLRYADKVERMPWVLRQVEGSGLDWLMISAFSFGPQAEVVENPSGFARERIAMLVERSGDDLAKIAQTSSRLLWVAQEDPNPLNRSLALHGLAELGGRVGADPASVLPAAGEEQAVELQQALARLEKHWPAARGAEGLSDDARADYRKALETLTRAPLASAAGQRSLMRTLERGLAIEVDSELLDPARAALERAVQLGIASGLRQALHDPAAEVREAAVTAIRKNGGPEAVAFVLYALTRTPSAQAGARNRYDDSVQVRMALVRLCAQLRPEQATRGHRDGPPPVEYLYDLIREEPGVPGLREAAFEALALCQRQPVSFDKAWVERWWREFLRQR